MIIMKCDPLPVVGDVGSVVGILVGTSVGLVGNKVGKAVGKVVGVVGKEVGCTEGLWLGVVGREVGALVGDLVGVHLYLRTKLTKVVPSAYTSAPTSPSLKSVLKGVPSPLPYTADNEPSRVLNWI